MLTQKVMAQIETMDLTKDELLSILNELAQYRPAALCIALARVESYR